MKKIIIGLFISSFLFACNSSTTEAKDTTTATAKKCDANNVDEAAKCLCEMFDQEDALKEKNDDAKLKEAEEKTNALNDKIDEAIKAGKYTEEELKEAAKKIGCEY